METQSSPFNIICLLLFFSTLFIIVRRLKKSKAESLKQKLKLPPGPWGFPVIGSLHYLIGALPHQALRDLARKYGPLMYLKLGEIPTIVISSPTMAKEILKTHDITFATRPVVASSNIVMYGCKDIAFAPYGDHWRQMRKICILELLSARMVKSFSSIRKDELSSLVSSIRSMDGSVVNMTSKLLMFSNSVICRSAFGNMCKDRETLILLMREVLLLLGGFDVSNLFPSWKLLHKMSGVESRLVNAHQKVDTVLENLVNEHIENRAAGSKGNAEFGGEDLVDVLLRVKENGELQFPITNDHIKAVIFDMFIAGTEASSTAIIWALSEMMRKPNVLAKAQSEVRQTFKGNKNFEEEDIEKLPYLKLVIKETLRLHPSSRFLGARECMNQINIDGYTIPLKTRVMINVWALGRDPDSWHDPDSFIPERFENSSVDFTGNHFEFVPFGAGRRMCPGMLFALTNIGYALAQLLYHFDWALLPGTNPEDLDMTESNGLTALKHNELFLIATNHKNDAEFS